MNKLKNKNEKGITLIALVITIIVLLILAGVAISMLSGENGILQQAAKSKTETEKSSTIEEMQLAGVTALAVGNGDIKNEKAIETLNLEMDKAGYDGDDITAEDLPVEDIIVKGLHFTIKENGEVVHLKWWFERDTDGNITDKITNGTQTLTLGDTIDYDPTDGITEDQKYQTLATKNGKKDQTFTLSVNSEIKSKQKLSWGVLGTDEDGNVLIMPTTDIKDEYGSTQYFYIDNIEGYINGVAELDKIAQIYGRGKGAKQARAIRVEDIDKITRGDKTTYGDGFEFKYGNEVTYSWTSTENQTYFKVKGDPKTYVWSMSGYAKNGFNWYDLESRSWKKSIQSNYTSFPVKIATIKSTAYSYDMSTKPETMNDNIYNLLFAGTGYSGAQHYILGSTCVEANNKPVYKMFVVFNYVLNLRSMEDASLSATYSYPYWPGIRPAVSLKSSIKFIPNGENSWTIQ